MKALTKREARLLVLLLVVSLSLTVRILTANFIVTHFNDAGWFQWGTYAVFDQQAQDILDGKESFFWIGDASRTELAIYPPGFRLWLALLYGVSGSRSPHVVQRVQVVLDALSVLLVVGIGVTAYGWRAGVAAGFLAALSPLLAISGATPMADAPTAWLVLAGMWMLLLCAKRKSLAWAIGAGIMLGLACWLRVNPLFLGLAWGLALALLIRDNWQRGALLGATVALVAAIVISPVVIRNLIVFYPEFMPTGLGLGVNLWAGIAETERGAEFGGPHPYSDTLLVEKERQELGLPADAPFSLHKPDGIRRDGERRRRALAVIGEHPLWYASVVARRGAGMFKYAGEPSPWLGSTGFNVTSKKTLPERWQTGALALFVNILGMIQSVMRYLALPLMLYGLWLALRSDWRTAGLILMTVLYYLLTLSIGHAEIRYGLPMQALLFVFAGLGLCQLVELVRSRKSKVQNQG